MTEMINSEHRPIYDTLTTSASVHDDPIYMEVPLSDEPVIIHSPRVSFPNCGDTRSDVEEATTKVMQVFGYDDPTDKMARICAPEYREKVKRILIAFASEVNTAAYHAGYRVGEEDGHEAGYRYAQDTVSEWNKP